MRVDDKQARIWYMNAAADGQWSYRTLARNISTQYYYRLMQTPQELQKEVIDEMVDKTKSFQNDKFDFIKNPVVAEFLGLPQNSAYSENKLETAIIDHIRDMAQYSILNDNKHIYQTKYLTFLPTKEELAREIERQKEIFRLQHGEEDLK